MSFLRLAAVFFRVGILNELQYRVNFFLQLLQSLVALATGLIGLSLVFNHTEALAGWSRPELLAVMGVHILMGGFIQSLGDGPRCRTTTTRIRFSRRRKRQVAPAARRLPLAVSPAGSASRSPCSAPPTLGAALDSTPRTTRRKRWE